MSNVTMTADCYKPRWMSGVTLGHCRYYRHDATAGALSKVTNGDLIAGSESGRMR